MMWLRSWKVRPNCAVLMARRSGLLVVEPILMLGFWVTGERIPATLYRGRKGGGEVGK